MSETFEHNLKAAQVTGSMTLAWKKFIKAKFFVAILRSPDDDPKNFLLSITRRTGDGKPVVNTKHVLRVMQQNGLTLQKHTSLRPGRTHDGVVVALRSNIRWCSDHQEIHARNGEVVRIVFVIDATGRSSPGQLLPMPASPVNWFVI